MYNAGRHIDLCSSGAAFRQGSSETCTISAASMTRNTPSVRTTSHGLPRRPNKFGSISKSAPLFYGGHLKFDIVKKRVSIKSSSNLNFVDPWCHFRIFLLLLSASHLRPFWLKHFGGKVCLFSQSFWVPQSVSTQKFWHPMGYGPGHR